MVYMTDAELAAIAQARGTSAEALQADYLEYDGEHWFIEVREGEHCPFLEGDRCAVHSVKPQQCRTYPFWPEIVGLDETWRAEAPYCPGIGQGPVYTASEIRALIRGRRSTG